MERRGRSEGAVEQGSGGVVEYAVTDTSWWLEYGWHNATRMARKRAKTH